MNNLLHFVDRVGGHRRIKRAFGRALAPAIGLMAAGALSFDATPAHANGAVLASDGSAPTRIDMQVAVAVTPYGSTRWSRLTVSGTKQVMWLVPAKPGARLDWATDAWLDALDEATAPRIAPPAVVAPCETPSTVERAPAWTNTATKRFPHATISHEREADVRAHAAAQGYGISAELASRIAAIYARGLVLVSVEINAPSAPFASPTLRVSDDGDAMLPFALTGAANTTPTHVTAYVTANGPVTLGLTSKDASEWPLSWGAKGSSYAETRQQALAGAGGALWIRESSAHAALFDGLPMPSAAPILPVAQTYFSRALGRPSSSCEAAIEAARWQTGEVGRTCAPGALETVDGGSRCEPTAGAVDASAFQCGSGVDDLAIAMSGLAPASAVVTRFAGLIPSGNLGYDAPIVASATSLSPLAFAARFDECAAPPSSGGSTSPPLTAPAAEVVDNGPTEYVTSGGCGGSTTIATGDDTTYDEGGGSEESSDSESCGTSGTSTSSGDDGESCSGSGSSSGGDDSSDDSGWDDDDDDDDDSSSDSCSGSSSSSSSSGSSDSDGWDESSASPKSMSLEGAKAGTEKEPQAKQGKHKKHKKHRKTSLAPSRRKSPVSRLAVAFVALLLPLRRRGKRLPPNLVL